MDYWRSQIGAGSTPAPQTNEHESKPGEQNPMHPALSPGRMPHLGKAGYLFDENQPTPILKFNAVLRNFADRYKVDINQFTAAVNAAGKDKIKPGYMTTSISYLKNDRLITNPFEPIRDNPDTFFGALPRFVHAGNSSQAQADREKLLGTLNKAFEQRLNKQHNLRHAPAQITTRDPVAIRLYTAWYNLVQRQDDPEKPHIIDAKILAAWAAYRGKEKEYDSSYVGACLYQLKNDGPKMALFRLLANEAAGFFAALEEEVGPIGATVKDELEAAAKAYMNAPSAQKDNTPSAGR